MKPPHEKLHGHLIVADTRYVETPTGNVKEHFYRCTYCRARQDVKDFATFQHKPECAVNLLKELT